MSTGKGSKSIRKSQLGNDLLPTVGFLNYVIKHKATAGQTTINLGSLNVPTEATALGFIQPSGAALSSIDLSRFKNNVKVQSKARGLMDNPIEYRITGQQEITLNVSAAEGEIFTITVDSQPKSIVNFTSAQPKVYSYTLAAGTTDIPAGSYTVNANPGEDVGDFMVLIDRQLQYRNTDNGLTGGDYQEIAGFVRMNTPDLINDRKVTLVWVGALVDNPQDSQLAMIQVLHGQLNALIPTVAAVAGVSEASLQVSPTDPDLAAFAATVIAQANRITELETIRSTYSTVGSNLKNGVNGVNLSMVGNSIIVPSGQEWELSGSIQFASNGVSPGFTQTRAFWSSANGDDASGILPNPPTNILGGFSGSAANYPNMAGTLIQCPSSPDIIISVPTVRVSAGTVFLVPLFAATTPANARISTTIYGRRIK